MKALVEATINKQEITSAVGNKTSSLTVNVTVSKKASWRLYSDKSCKKIIESNEIKLKVGLNKVYIKVTAEDGTTSNVYTLSITREKAQKTVLLIATKYDFADSFAGGVLAIQLGGEVILTGVSEGDAKTMVSYIKKNYSKQDQIYIIGLEQAVYGNLEKMLNKLGYNNIIE